MGPFRTLTAIAAPFEMANVNTDQIFPARFIRKPRGPGYAAYAFHDLRFADHGGERPDFVLNDPRFRHARILVAGSNFGCGSSREGAVYALQDKGFRVLVAPSFGDIFAANCLKNGVLTICLPVEVAAALRRELAEADRPRMTVDLEAQRIIRPGGAMSDFEVDPFGKQCLLAGLNEIDLSLRHENDIAAFEQAYRERFAWLYRRPRDAASESAKGTSAQ
jgi:3-isopropylmalate/(R)-2-methylmalate dehydratase small subunit